MEGKGDCAQEQVSIPFPYAEAFCHAKQIHAHRGNQYTDPYVPPCLFFHKNPQNRHNDNVESRDKACFPHGGIHNPQLLQRAACKQGGSAADSAYDSGSAPCLPIFLCPVPLFPVSLTQNQDTGNQHYPS